MTFGTSAEKRMAGTMDNELGRCDECIFWLRDKGQLNYRGRQFGDTVLSGRCHRRGPKEEHRDGGGYWPPTLADEFCGEGVHEEMREGDKG